LEATRVKAGFPSPIEVTMGEEMIPKMAERCGKDRRMRRVDGGMVTEARNRRCGSGRR
jgi:hypothetical protein